jgi:hypothetical protein
MDENALRAQLAEALAWRGAHLSFLGQLVDLRRLLGIAV